MSYLYNKDINVLNANAIVTTSNPFPVTAVGDGLEVKGISPDALVGAALQWREIY